MGTILVASGTPDKSLASICCVDHSRRRRRRVVRRRDSTQVAKSAILLKVDGTGREPSHEGTEAGVRGPFWSTPATYYQGNQKTNKPAVRPAVPAMASRATMPGPVRGGVQLKNQYAA
jgi:hypothetical protein